MAFNILAPNKKLSQLIAKSWLDGERLTFERDWLIEQGVLTKKEAPYYNIQVDTNPTPSDEGIKYVGYITQEYNGNLCMYIPYPEKPEEEKVSNQELSEWVNDSNPNNWLPTNPWIPYSC